MNMHQRDHTRLQHKLGTILWTCTKGITLAFNINLVPFYEHPPKGSHSPSTRNVTVSWTSNTGNTLTSKSMLRARAPPCWWWWWSPDSVWRRGSSRRPHRPPPPPPRLTSSSRPTLDTAKRQSSIITNQQHLIIFES